MNNKFKKSIVAFVAIISGSTFGTCHAMQDSAQADSPIGTGIVLAEQQPGTFGAVKPAVDNSSYFRKAELPPIVSAKSASVRTTLGSVPPIVTPKFNTAPIPKVVITKSAMLAPIAAEPAAQQPAPRKPMEVQAIPVAAQDSPAEFDPMMAPPTVMQATGASVDPTQDPNVAPAQWSQQGYAPGAVSSAGIPLYPDPVSAAPSVMTKPTNLPPIISASSQRVVPSQSVAPPASIPTTQVGFSTPPTSYASPAPAYAQAATATPTYFSGPPVEPPVIQGASCDSGCATPAPVSNCGECGGGGCNDCGVASCGTAVSSCNSCGSGGCYNASNVASRYGTSGSVSAARRYLLADALYFDRSDGTISNSNFGSLNNFDWDAGWRVTIGAKSDSLRGREITYMGILPLSQSATRTDNLGRINASIAGAGGFGVETSAFANAVSQTEFKETEFHSLEFNRVTWGWDVIKSFVGLRFIYLEDEYQTTSTNLVGDTGVFQLMTNNNLIGPHIGGEIFYDVGYRLSYSLFSKFGAYANFNQVDTILQNAGARFLDVEDNSVTVSGSIELGLIAHYQLSQTARLRAGYNVLFLGELATAADNFSPVISPIAGTSSSDSDDVFFHGLSVGLEIFR